jgi:citrate lyase gamma subunit
MKKYCSLITWYVSQVLRLLIKTTINLNAKNLENKTALDMAIMVEIKSILLRAGAKPGLEVTDSQTPCI